MPNLSRPPIIELEITHVRKRLGRIYHWPPAPSSFQLRLLPSKKHRHVLAEFPSPLFRGIPNENTCVRFLETNIATSVGIAASSSPVSSIKILRGHSHAHQAITLEVLLQKV